MKKILLLAYGIFCYLAFIGTVLYAVGFWGNMLVSKPIDREPQTSLLTALLIDAILIVLFVLQYRVMMSRSFKSRWMRLMPMHLERCSYVLLVSACLAVMMWLWQPVGGVVWSIEDEALKTLLQIGYFSGWSIVFVSTFLINHFDLFGLRQVWLYFKGRSYRPLSFRLPLFYRLVRHPLYLGFLIVFWSAPVMTMAHLLLAVCVTGYVVTTIRFEGSSKIVEA
jgi:methanethiol S-methyltransferase